MARASGANTNTKGGLVRPSTPEAPPIAAIPPPSAVDLVLNYLLESMDRGELVPGDPIVSVSLSSQLGLSRAPVREALHVLAGRGLVELLPNRCAVMRKMTRAEAIQVFEVACALCSRAIAVVAGREKTAPERTRIAEAFDQVRQAAEMYRDFRFYLALNRYQETINELCGNPFIDELLRKLNIDYMCRFVAHLIDISANLEKYVGNYRRITDSILANDERSAESAMNYHMRWSVDLMNRAPKESIEFERRVGRVRHRRTSRKSPGEPRAKPSL